MTSTVKYYFWGDAVRTYQFTYADGTAVTAKVGGMCIHYVDGVVAYCIEPGTGSSHNVTYTGTPGEESAFWMKKANPTAKERYQFDPAVRRPQLYQKHRQGHGIRV